MSDLLPCKGCGMKPVDAGTASRVLPGVIREFLPRFTFSCPLLYPEWNKKRSNQCVGPGAGSTTREGAVEDWNDRQLPEGATR